jgi:hypothetical protein
VSHFALQCVFQTSFLVVYNCHIVKRTPLHTLLVCKGHNPFDWFQFFQRQSWHRTQECASATLTTVLQLHWQHTCSYEAPTRLELAGSSVWRLFLRWIYVQFICRCHTPGHNQFDWFQFFRVNCNTYFFSSYVDSILPDTIILNVFSMLEACVNALFHVIEGVTQLLDCVWVTTCISVCIITVKGLSECHESVSDQQW